MKEFKKGQTCFAASEDGSAKAIVWEGRNFEQALVRQGRLFHTATEAKARAEELLHERDMKDAASKGFRGGQNYYSVVPRMSKPTTYVPVESTWYHDPIDVRRLRQGIAFRTWEDAEEKAEELNRTDKSEPRYPRKQLVWNEARTKKKERMVLGKLAGYYMTVEDFGETLMAATSEGSTKVRFYRNAEDLPETLEDYLAEIELPEGAAEKIVELAKKIKL